MSRDSCSSMDIYGHYEREKQRSCLTPQMRSPGPTGCQVHSMASGHQWSDSVSEHWWDHKASSGPKSSHSGHLLLSPTGIWEKREAALTTRPNKSGLCPFLIKDMLMIGSKLITEWWSQLEIVFNCHCQYSFLFLLFFVVVKVVFFHFCFALFILFSFSVTVIRY